MQGHQLRRSGELIEWPDRPAGDWLLGYVGGIFDAEGSFNDGTIRIANTDQRIIEVLLERVAAVPF